MLSCHGNSSTVRPDEGCVEKRLVRTVWPCCFCRSQLPLNRGETGRSWDGEVRLPSKAISMAPRADWWGKVNNPDGISISTCSAIKRSISQWALVTSWFLTYPMIIKALKASCSDRPSRDRTKSLSTSATQPLFIRSRDTCAFMAGTGPLETAGRNQPYSWVQRRNIKLHKSNRVDACTYDSNNFSAFLCAPKTRNSQASAT